MSKSMPAAAVGAYSRRKSARASTTSQEVSPSGQTVGDMEKRYVWLRVENTPHASAHICHFTGDS
jgi:hypothetical protein